MASSLTVTSACNSDSNNIRDVSFSSYLNSAEESFILQLSESHNKQLRRKSEEEGDGEIGVFGAEKYFNGGMDDECSRVSKKITSKRHQQLTKELTDLPSVKPKKQPSTPSSRSESSWNSQIALLQRSSSQVKSNKARQGKSFLGSIGCKCACYDGKAIEIDDDKVKEPIKNVLNSQGNLNTEDCFSFPVAKINVPLQEEEDDDDEEKGRKSLEVFGSPVFEKGTVSVSPERRFLSMLNWNPNPRIEEENEIQRNSIDNDTESDASSDLFEIESLTSNNNPSLTRQESTCYEPSEASIEWSVVTAKTVDLSTISESDYDDRRREILIEKTVTGKDGQRRRPGILLGCKSHKAVRVANDVYKTNERGKTDPWRHNGNRFGSPVPMSRFQSETKLVGFDSHSSRWVKSPSDITRASHILCIK